jgi:predicted anti-sigma-YlaC factor YlaD
MDQDSDVVQVARAMIARFGLDAAAIIDGRVESHLSACESEGAELWRRVAEAIRALQSRQD